MEGMSSGHGGPSMIIDPLLLLGLTCWGAVDMVIDGDDDDDV